MVEQSEGGVVFYLKIILLWRERLKMKLKGTNYHRLFISTFTRQPFILRHIFHCLALLSDCATHNIFMGFFCVACQEWLTHRDHDHMTTVVVSDQLLLKGYINVIQG